MFPILIFFTFQTGSTCAVGQINSRNLYFLTASIAETLDRKFGRSVSHMLWDIQAWKCSNMRKICICSIFHIAVKWWRSWVPKTKFHPLIVLGILNKQWKNECWTQLPTPPNLHPKNWKKLKKINFSHICITTRQQWIQWHGPYHLYDIYTCCTVGNKLQITCQIKTSVNISS